jgi:hypothetical protein
MRQPRRPRRRSVGDVWLQQRSRSWLWAALFVLVVLAVVVVLFALDPATAATGQSSGQSFSHQGSSVGPTFGTVND